MIGSIAGDIIGSRFEFKFDRMKSKNFELFTDEQSCTWTDDTVMTLATAKAIMDIYRLSSWRRMKRAPEIFSKYYREFGLKYPNAGYGFHFYQWINNPQAEAYGSYGNGAAMRVSPCGLVASTLKEAEMLGAASASVTHNHEEGIKGAKCIAGAVFWAKRGKDKDFLKKYVEKYYEIPEDINKVREKYVFDASCQGSVPEALMCFFEAESYEDCMRNCVSLGGDTDTMCAIVGTIAELYFGMPDNIQTEALNKLNNEFITIINTFNFFLKMTHGCKKGIEKRK